MIHSYEARRVPTDKFYIDSMNVYIPTDKCDYVSDELQFTTTEEIRIAETGEFVTERTNPNPLFKIAIGDGVNLNYRRYYKRLIGSQVKRVECLELRLTAKHCLKSYFKGIGKDSIEIIFNYIRKTNLIDISFKNFMKYAEVLDIDFCRNHYITDSDNYIAGTKEIKKYSKLLNPNVKVRRFKDAETENYGLEFGKRHLKIYWKCGELMTKSIKFYTSYLTEYDITNLFRVEFNIPNNAEFKRLFNDKIMSLTNVLNLNQDDIMQAYADVSKKYLAPPVNKEVVSKHRAEFIGILELLKVMNKGVVTRENIEWYLNFNPAYVALNSEDSERRRVNKLKSAHRKKLEAVWNDGYRDISWKQHKTDQMELFNILSGFVR